MKNPVGSYLISPVLLGVLLLCCSVWASGATTQLRGGDSTSNSVVADVLDNSTTTSIKTSAFKPVESQTNRRLLGCGSGNPIDICWQCGSSWESNRQKLADCAIGFGRGAAGGRDGSIYVVTDAGNDNPANPLPGTLRYAAIQSEPLWIIFKENMRITLKEELIVASHKTFDGRGANVHIAGGGCFVLQKVSNVIIHGLHIHDCKSTGPARVRSSLDHIGSRGKTDGDGISLLGASNVWIDHNYLSNCADGLIDVIHGSDKITISNNYFEKHDKVMLIGAHDSDYEDKNMHVTVAFNYFGEGLEQRMPRCRLGFCHILNNFYKDWLIYAIGGSANPTINSEGNHFQAGAQKKVNKVFTGDGNWRSSGDLFLNGAWFQSSGASFFSSTYETGNGFSALHASQVPSLTANAGPV